LSSASCIRVVPEATSTDCDEASTVASNVRFGYSGIEITALAPILIAGT